MKQKENIFEELNKMKNLIKAKPGTVISEQEIDEIGFGAYAAAQQQKTPSGYDLSGTKTVSERQKNINGNFCSVKNGVIVTGGYSNGTKWDDYVKTYSVTADELATAKASCPSSKKVGGSQQSSVNDKFAASAKSLGIQNAKMDAATLQTMLKSLEDETPSSTPTQATPDIAQLTAALNQLNQ